MNMQKSNDIQQNAAAISNPENESTTGDKYQPMLEQIQPFTKVSFVDLPESLRERIGGSLAGYVWDLRSPSGRIEYARGYDFSHDPARAIESRAVRWIAEMDADSWWSAESITPVHAAMLLSRFNPNEDKIEDAERTSSDEMGPEDFRRLKNIFEGASKENPRTLKDWTDYARQRGLKMHSWINEWEAWVHEVDARATPEPPMQDAPRGITKQQVLTAFEELLKGKLRLGKALGDGKGLFGDTQARTRKGTRGGKHAALWNPVILAIGLNDQYKISLPSLKKAFYDNKFLKEWLEEWHEKIEDLS
jgi:hypothetical protein